MKKFITRKKTAKSGSVKDLGSGSQRNSNVTFVVKGPDLSDREESDFRRINVNHLTDNTIHVLEEENRILKSTTQKLLAENIELKEKLSDAREANQKLIEETNTQKTSFEASSNEICSSTQTPENRDEPNWEEIRHLVQLITDENEFLLRHIQAERAHMRSIKDSHSLHLQKVTDDLQACQMEKTFLEGTVHKMRLDLDRLKTQLILQTEENSDGSVPLAEHQKMVKQLEDLFKQLKSCYVEELHKLKVRCDNADDSLRRLSVETARLQANFNQSKNKIKMLKHKLKNNSAK